MASIAKLVVSLGANIADFETDMKRAGRISKTELRKMERQAKQLNDQWNRNFRLAGAAVAGGLALATKAAIDFESAMAEVATLGASDIDALGDSVKRLSVEFGQAPVDQAKALYQIISAGAATAADQIEILTVANKLAVGGLTDVATAADGLTTTLNAYELSASDASRVSDVFFNTMKQGKTTIPEINAAIGNVATIAAQAGVSLEELGAATALVTKQGQDTAKSMDGLRGVLSAVLKQSNQTQKAAKDIGIEFDLARLKSVGLVGVLTDIAESGATADQLSKLVGRVEGLTNVLALVKDGGQAFVEELVKIQSGAKATDDAVKLISGSTKFLVDQLTSAAKVVAINFGEKMLPVVQRAAIAITTNMDAVVRTIETLVTLLVTRLAVGGVAAFLSAASAAKTLATAMAIVGGPLGLAALAIAALIANLDKLTERSPALAEFVDRISRGFAILADVAIEVGLAIGNLTVFFVNIVRIGLEPLKEAIYGVLTAFSRLSAGDLEGAFDALRIGDDIVAEWEDAGRQIAQSFEAMQSRAGKAWDAIQGGAEKSTAAAADLGKGLDKVADSAQGAAKPIDAIADAAADAAKAAEANAKAMQKSAKAMDEAARAADDAEQDYQDYVRALEDANREQEAFNQSVESLLDSLYPMEAATRNFVQQLNDLRQYADDAGWSADRLADAEVRLAEQFGDTTRAMVDQQKQVDLLATAIDEGARIMERAFTDAWRSILDGAEFSFSAIADGFKSLLANLIHQATTQKITLQFQRAFGPDGGGFGDINWKSLGQDFANFGALALGQAIADTEWGQIGSSVGGLIGEWAAEKFLTSVLGSFAGPIGTALGAILGAVAGDWISGLFDRPLQYTLGGAANQRRADAQQITTPLGDIFGIQGQGGFGSLNDPSTFGGQLAQVLIEFDKQMATILRETVDDETFRSIQASLENWRGTWGENATAADVLQSRFSVILNAFSSDIQGFVRNAASFEEQIERFGVALAADQLVSENAGIFGDRTVGEFLKVVEAFKTGGKTMAEAFQEVVILLGQVAGAMDTLRQYADSDLAGDFAIMLGDANRTLYESVALMQSSMMSAIANFDGSTDQLQAIGQMSMTIRENELRLLQLIDSIAKGVNSNLDKLKADLFGGGPESKNFGQLFTEAESLMAQIASAETPEEVARLTREFDALIRAMDESSIANFGTDLILPLINAFQEAANERLQLFRDDTVANAEATRELVDVFLNDIGDPLKVLANSNQQIADALNPLASGEFSDQFNEDNEAHQDEVERILGNGVNGISREVSNIGPAIADAIALGFGRANVNVSVQVSDDLVNG